MVDRLLPEAPKTLTCYGISQKDTFTVYRVEKHPEFYKWFRNLVTDLGVENKDHRDFHLYDVESDMLTTYGPKDRITTVVGDQQIMILFKDKPNPETMLNHVDMVKPHSKQE